MSTPTLYPKDSVRPAANSPYHPQAWVALAPYLIGALALQSYGAGTTGGWMFLLAYLVLFPLIWRRLARRDSGLQKSGTESKRPPGL